MKAGIAGVVAVVVERQLRARSSELGTLAGYVLCWLLLERNLEKKIVVNGETEDLFL
jgi:hypothetical protein